MDGRPTFTVSGSSRPASFCFFPALQGSACAPLPCGNGYAALPIGRRLHCFTRNTDIKNSKFMAGFISITCLIFAMLLMLVFISCSDSNPSIAKVEHSLVFDYKDESSPPQVRLSVFVQPNSSVLRAKEISAVHEESGMEWLCQSPVVFHGGDGKDYAGCTSFVPPYNSELPQGIYYVFYRDKAGRECEAEFSVNFTADFALKNYDQLPNYVSIPNNERIALYNSEGILIYCGKRREEWKDNAAILADYGTAEKMRVCYESGTLFFMLPFEPLQKQ